MTGTKTAHSQKIDNGIDLEVGKLILQAHLRLLLIILKSTKDE